MKIERGSEAILAYAAQAVEHGKLNPVSAEILEWLLTKYPQLGRNAWMRICDPDDPPMGFIWNGFTNAIYRIRGCLVAFLRGGDHPKNVIHEFMHHAERMLPAQLRDALVRAWFLSFRCECGTVEHSRKMALIHQHGATIDESEEYTLKYRAAVDEKLLDLSDDYRYASPSEFWAELSTEYLLSLYSGKETYVNGTIKEAVKYLLEVSDGGFLEKNVIDNAELRTLIEFDYDYQQLMGWRPETGTTVKI